MKLDGKVAVITGAASGIGRGLAERFAQEGARLLLADVDEAGVREVAEELEAHAVAADLSREAGVLQAVETARSRLGPIDLMFSNAGIGIAGGVEVPDDDWDRIWRINVMSHIWAARAVLPAMLERGEGYLCSTASAAGLLSQIGSAPYSVTKHAAVGLAEWIAITYGDRGIRVSVLCPQAVRSKMTAGGDGGVAGLDGMLEPEDVAEATVRAIEEERFLILPHPEVETYMQRKVADYDRWLAGMRRLQAKMTERPGGIGSFGGSDD
jgi:NAD(P)-dependent dehydrogenase (short-subunit alcohol dehydrogenase family)